MIGARLGNERLVPRMVAALERHGLRGNDDEDGDVARLREMGVDGVFPVGSLPGRWWSLSGRVWRDGTDKGWTGTARGLSECGRSSVFVDELPRNVVGACERGDNRAGTLETFGGQNISLRTTLCP